MVRHGGESKGKQIFFFSGSCGTDIAHISGVSLAVSLTDPFFFSPAV